MNGSGALQAARCLNGSGALQATRCLNGSGAAQAARCLASPVYCYSNVERIGHDFTGSLARLRLSYRVACATPLELLPKNWHGQQVEKLVVFRCS